jgi:hypothetical protein
MATLLEKLPTMSDADLANLLTNAIRLTESGTKRQQDEASQLLPALTDEVEGRSARAKEEASAKKASAARRSGRKKAPAVVTDQDEGTAESA